MVNSVVAPICCHLQMLILFCEWFENHFLIIRHFLVIWTKITDLLSFNRTKLLQWKVRRLLQGRKLYENLTFILKICSFYSVSQQTYEFESLHGSAIHLPPEWIPTFLREFPMESLILIEIWSLPRLTFLAPICLATTNIVDHFHKIIICKMKARYKNPYFNWSIKTEWNWNCELN